MRTVNLPTHDAKGEEIGHDEHGWRFWHMAESGNGIHVECRACKHIVQVNAAALERRFGRHCTLQALRPSLKCSKCGSLDITAYIIGMSGSPHPGVVSEAKRAANAEIRSLLTDPEN